MNIPNPCDREGFANLWTWLATDCWCCSGFRAVLAIGLPLLWLGTMIPDGLEMKLITGVLALLGVAYVAYLAVMTDEEGAPK